MSQQPFTAAALRGAVDLSSLKRPAPQAGPASGAGAMSSGAETRLYPAADSIEGQHNDSAY